MIHSMNDSYAEGQAQTRRMDEAFRLTEGMCDHWENRDVFIWDTCDVCVVNRNCLAYLDPDRDETRLLFLICEDCLTSPFYQFVNMSSAYGVWFVADEGVAVSATEVSRGLQASPELILFASHLDGLAAHGG